jgi:DNA-binding transcriptional regulator LsrR (DeoR family)
MTQPQHKIVSLVGNMAHDGRASHYEIVMHLADRINAQAFLMPTPVVASSADERDFLQQQRSFLAVRDLAAQAKLVVVGIGEIGWNCPLHKDGFINDADVSELLECGAVCDLLAWAFDREGRLVEASTNARVGGLSLDDLPARRTVAVAGGARKLDAIRAALHGRLIAGLITDETTARALLAT